ncbi:hypothetical protein Ddye_005864 [Dipteronia dyeriana]|uniref:Clp ATPase C-terminal domain-containing protein n=1 Tax=Dipteronia dyeriana TaxID=168575 RepID=A0AAD9XHJ0_9ROSI|nr:hypothetical protein Ddye_005864 [Dipteronia dyeriana]
MTSNIGSQHILKAIRHWKNNSKDYEMMEEQAEELVRNKFRLEFINSIDRFILFFPLDANQIYKSVNIQLKILLNKIKENKIDLRYTNEAVELLATLRFNLNSWFRLVKREIHRHIEDDAAIGVMKGELGRKIG